MAYDPTVRILQLEAGAAQARGLAVIIDVFRACSTACFLAHSGAGRIYPVGDLEQARTLADTLPGALRVGERSGVRPDGFDFGNSPTQFVDRRLDGRSVVLTTSAGTHGFEYARGADTCLTGSLVNAGAIVRYIREHRPREVSLVCMGHRKLRPSDEDTLCAEYLRDCLRGEHPDTAALAASLRTSPDAARFFDAQKPWAPESDFALCTDFNRFDFVLRLRRDGAAPYLERVDLTPARS